ncbi:MAG: phosphotriesterase-related protein [Chloroflexi bacterium]|jgi:phosphotriesterase-related protein|nr:MAG: phosphotriesterase-related protein [Chloroflexota bacterium]
MSNTSAGLIQTVLGPLAPNDLGITMSHEHLLLDITCYVQQADEASNRSYRHALIKMDNLGRLPERFQYSLENMTLLSEDAAIEEAFAFKLAGGSSFVDTTSGVGIGRDPLGLARISRSTGLNVVMGSGYYVWQSHPENMDDKDVDLIAHEIIDEFENGVNHTGIKPGVIGEIGCSWPIHPNELKSLQAASIAQKHTGAPMTLHPVGPRESKDNILNAIQKAGGNCEKVIFGHLDHYSNLDDLLNLLKAGCYIQLDVFGWEDTSLELIMPGVKFGNDNERIDIIAELVDMGYQDKILIAQDVCQKWQYRSYGGKGFSHILENMIGRFKDHGFSDTVIDALLVDNPSRVFAFD